MARNKIRGKAGVKFKSPYTTEKRTSQLRNLVTDLIVFEQVKVTGSAVEGVVSLISKLVTLAKKGDLHSRRQAAAIVRNVYVDEEQTKTALQKLFDDIAKRYAGRSGGYVSTYKVGNRRGDNAPITLITFVK